MGLIPVVVEKTERGERSYYICVGFNIGAFTFKR